MPKVEFPATFENGVIGTRCTSDIQNREAFMFIPYKMMLTESYIHNNPVLKTIINDNPDCFINSSYHMHLTLTLGVLYEVSLGIKSYWYPWLRQVLQGLGKSTCFWEEQELNMV